MNKLLQIFFIIITIFYSYVASTKAQSEEIYINFSPAYMIRSVITGEKVQGEFAVSANTAEWVIAENVYDRYYTKQTGSDLFSQITESKLEGSLLSFQIDTSSLEDSTYFFGFEVSPANTNGIAITGELHVILPVILTVNTSIDSMNPSPFFGLEVKRYYLNYDDVKIKTEFGNRSKKLINFGGEILLIDSLKNVPYSQRIGTSDSRVYPGEATIQNIIPGDLKFSNGMPFIGEVQIEIRGTVNGEKHIKSELFKFWILPWYYLVVIGLGLLLFFTASFSFIKKHWRSLYKKRVKLLKEKSQD